MRHIDGDADIMHTDRGYAGFCVRRPEGDSVSGRPITP